MRELLAFQDADPASPIFDSIRDWLAGQFFGGSMHALIGVTVVLAATLAVSLFALYAAKLIVLGMLRRIARRTRTRWDDILIERRFFSRLAHLAPAVVCYYAAGLLPDNWADALVRFSQAYMIVVGVLVTNSFLSALYDIYGTLKIARSNPIKGFVQVAQIFVYVMGGIFLISLLMGRSPWNLVASIGAVTAVLLLVFKDTILGLVATVQIIVNKLVNLGDWIEMPQYGADGDVIDITLTSVKVQNWDKTITTIPTYALISESFKNWRGMQESGGRRIKRSIAIDIASVQFLSDEMIGRFEKFQLLADYIRTRQQEVADYNREHDVDTSEAINGRRLTNLGTFRAYLKQYLSRHPQIHEGMTFLVRQLPPGEHGLPLEIYVFSKDQAWANYEEIQADIFDHLLAVIPEFGLRVFQDPSGGDFRDIAQAIAGRN